MYLSFRSIQYMRGRYIRVYRYLYLLDGKIDLFAFLHVHNFVFGHNVVLISALMQIICQINSLKAAFFEITHGSGKKLVIIGLEVYLAMGHEYLILFKLPWMGKPSLPMRSPWPRIAEIDIYSVHSIVFAQHILYDGDLLSGYPHVLRFFLSFLVGSNGLPYRKTQNSVLDVYCNIVDLGVLNGYPAYEPAFAAAKLYMKRLMLCKSFMPCIYKFFGSIGKKGTGVQLFLSPRLFAHSHK